MMLAMLTMREIVAEDPHLIPEVIPDREERRRDELADVWCDADNLQPEDYEIIQHEIDQCDDSITTSNFDTMFFQSGVFEHPETLQHIVYGPAGDAGSDLGPPQTPAKSFIT